MEMYLSTILGTPVFENEEIRPLTTVKDLIIDPENGKLIGIIVDVNKNLIIAPFDIYSWKEVIRINNRSLIVSADEVLRVEAVQKSGKYIHNSKVYSKDGDYLGKVMDYSLDGGTYGLKKLIVANNVLGLLRYGSRIIPAKDIVEVLPNKIVVKENVKPIKEGKKVPIEDMAAT